ncbi:hypothetical protein [Kaarinaea lacus]
MVSYRSSQKLAIWSAYILHLLIAPTLIAMLINIVKVRQYQRIEFEDDSDDTIPVALLLTHHQWSLRSLGTLAILSILSAATFFYGIGVYVLAAIASWWWYRMLRGMLNLTMQQPMPSFEDRHSDSVVLKDNSPNKDQLNLSNAHTQIRLT